MLAVKKEWKWGRGDDCGRHECQRGKISHFLQCRGPNKKEKIIKDETIKSLEIIQNYKKK